MQMRVSREEKERTHQRIVEIASERIREAGLEGPGVAEIMKSAGLTHGGFYKHFGSRDDLIAEAADHAFTASDDVVREFLEEDDPLAAFVDWYVSEQHRDNPATGCPVVALGEDVTRADDRVRDAYRRQVERYLAVLEKLLGGDGARQRATVALSTLIGSVTLARALGADPLSDEILRDARAALKDA
jgi:TetR/AcrR family transcriptional regulator, transcriptional repressor for nem operon